MSSYITKTDLYSEFISLQEAIRLFADKATPGAAEPAAVDDDILNPIITSASDEIDGYARRRYTVPFTTAPQAIKRLCIRLVLYEGYKRRKALTQQMTDEHKDDLRWLRDLSNGVVDVGVEPPPAANSSRTIEVTSTERTFTADSMKGLL